MLNVVIFNIITAATTTIGQYFGMQFGLLPALSVVLGPGAAL
jgi:hypothetical protein